MEDKSARPNYQTVEVPDLANKPGPASVDIPSTPPPNMPPAQEKPKGAFKNEPHREHPFRKFLFIIPAVILVGTIAVAAYLTRTDYTLAPPPAPSATPSLPEATTQPTLAPRIRLARFSNDRFTFQHPETLVAIDCESGVYLAKKTESGPDSSGVCADPLSSAVVSITNPNTNFSVNDEEFLGSEPVTISGIETEVVEFRAGEGSNLISEIEFEGVIYSFRVWDTLEENSFKTISATFQFIVDITKDWVLFDNSYYNFTMLKPPDWQILQSVNRQGVPENRAIIRRDLSETKLQNLTVVVSTNLENAASTASDTVSSTRSLAGWEGTPKTELRSIGGASATIIEGQFQGFWNSYVVIWHKNSVIEMIWEDDADKTFYEIFENMINSFKLLS